MASIRRTDIKQNKSILKACSSRSTKADRDRNRKRQEAYRWRDARRIYLASSFDRWRKLRCSLGMKDSVLAWHLMEAHEKNKCDISCDRSTDEGDSAFNKDKIQHFSHLLINTIRQLCVSQFQFENCIKVVGLLCLEFDNSRKEKFNVDETIQAKPQADTDSYASQASVSEYVDHCQPSSKSFELFVGENPEKKFLDVSSCHIESKFPISPIQENSTTVCSQFLPQTAQYEELVQPMTLVVHNEKASCEEVDKSSIVETSEAPVESEAEISLEIDVENVDTSQEMEDSFHHKTIAIPAGDDKLSANGKVDLIHHPLSVKEQEMDKSEHCEERRTSSVTGYDNSFSCSSLPNQTSVSPEESHSIKMKTSQPPSCTATQPQCSSTNPNSELPLDMSLMKSSVGSEKQETREEDKIKSSDFVDLFATKNEKLDFEVPAMIDTAFPHLPGSKQRATPPTTMPRSKDEIQSSIPWQRRDMSRKEEYEFLELNPFSDLSEFSQKFPHVHQRTYYRWKRRIKEEYILLEQCPHMSFEQFSSVVLQAKVSVYNLWKSFIAQGKGFFAPSDVSKRLEAKCSSSKAMNTLSEQYSFLQNDLLCTQDQFCSHFKNASLDVFISLKRKVMHEFWMFCQNQHKDWKEFSKLVDISEETYRVWQEHSLRDTSILTNSHLPGSHVVQQQFPHTNLPATECKESVPRSLSASYLNSMQNVMFPWASYYGMHNQLNPSVLPMMLWPPVMGVNGSAGPLGLPPPPLASSPSSCGSKAESPQDFNTPFAAPNSMASHYNQQGSFSESGSLPSISTFQELGRPSSQTTKRSSSVVVEGQVASKETNSPKKSKLKEELENVASSPVSKSRKQNKQEYIYYLKNPSLTFKDLETLFPTISLRTFYRWRREMNASLLFLQQNRNSSYDEFKSVFPNIPEEIFETWKQNAGRVSFPEGGSIERTFGDSTEERLESNGNEESYSYLYDKSDGLQQDATITGSSLVLQNMSSYEKHMKDGEIFLHQNPSVQYETFSQLFPSVPSHNFYQWKNDWKQGIEYLQINPALTYDMCKSSNPSLSRDIFEAWTSFLTTSNSKPRQTHETNAPSVKLEIVDHSQDKYLEGNSANTPKELVYLQMNPDMEFDKFSQTFPHVQHETFVRWKEEVLQILNYIRSRSSVTFAEISAVLPNVTEEAFNVWQERIAWERPKEQVVKDVQNSDSSKGIVDAELKETDEAKTKMTKALLYLMHNPHIQFKRFHELFPIVSLETFDLWLHRIKAVILHISTNPSLKFDEFRSAVSDIGEDIFQEWKSLTSEQISNIGKQTLEPFSSEPEATDEPDESYRARALYLCKSNPLISFDSFSTQFDNISKIDFQCWMLKISAQMSFIRDNPNFSYEDFKGIYPDVERMIFDLWRKLSLEENVIEKIIAPSFVDIDEEAKSKKESYLSSSECVTQAIETVSHHTPKQELSSLVQQKDASYVPHRQVEEEESSLRKLFKLTESDPFDRELNSHSFKTQGEVSNHHINDLLQHPANPLSEYVPENYLNNNSNNSSYVSSNLENLMAHNSTVSSSVLSEKQFMQINPEQYYTASHNNQENQALSALKAMSTDSQSSSSERWKNTHLSSNTKEEEDLFSSQRQKKMCRAEYLFVKDNPDVDSQEFSRIFPGVSARTFYRWKKEIKAQMHFS